MTNKYSILGASVLLVIANILIDHYFAPIGLFFIPVVIIVPAALINLTPIKLDSILRVIFTYIIIALSDIGMKLYAGGNHDWEAQGWMNMLLFAGLVPCFIILVISVFKTRRDSIRKKFISLMLFLILVSLHLYFFGNLGIGRHYEIHHS